MADKRLSNLRLQAEQRTVLPDHDLMLWAHDEIVRLRTARTLVAIVIAVRIVWGFTILIGTAYVVFWLGYSGWWWVPSLILIACASAMPIAGERRE